MAQELQTQEKKELVSKGEKTVPARYYVRGLRAPLSPKEEAALQQVAMANPDAEKLQDPIFGD
jgi:hypothetical protein